MINGYKSLREKDRAERAIAEGRNPNAKGRPARVSKEEKIVKRRARQAKYSANSQWKAKKYAAKNMARRIAYAETAAAEGRPIRKWRLTAEEKKIAKKLIYNKWRKANMEHDAVRSRNRRALKKGNGGTHTKADIKQLFFKQKGLCGLCDLKLDADNFHVDHWKPLSKGGSNDKDNLKLLHPRCNLMKSDILPEELGLRINKRSS